MDGIVMMFEATAALEHAVALCAGNHEYSEGNFGTGDGICKGQWIKVGTPVHTDISK